MIDMSQGKKIKTLFIDFLEIFLEEMESDDTLAYTLHPIKKHNYIDNEPIIIHIATDSKYLKALYKEIKLVENSKDFKHWLIEKTYR